MPEARLRTRFLFQQLLLRDLVQRYGGSWLGPLWSLLEPLGLSVAYWFVFGFVARRADPARALDLLLALLPWTLFAGIVQQGAGALTRERNMLRKVYFPRTLLVSVCVASQAIQFVVSLAVLVPFALAFDAHLGWGLLALPIAASVLATLGAGAAFLLSLANTLTRDVEHAVRLGLRFLFYASPVVYAVEDVPVAWRALYLANPLAPPLSLARGALTAEPSGPSGVALASAALAALGLLALGRAVFRAQVHRAVKLL